MLKTLAIGYLVGGVATIGYLWFQRRNWRQFAVDRGISGARLAEFDTGTKVLAMGEGIIWPLTVRNVIQGGPMYRDPATWTPEDQAAMFDGMNSVL